jgi:hypothetical protein
MLNKEGNQKMYTNITEKQALDYITEYAARETGGDFLGAMIKLKENIATEPDIKLRVCFAVAFAGFSKFFAEVE